MPDMELLEGIAAVSTAIIVGGTGIMISHELRRRRRDRARADWWRQVEVAIPLAVGRAGDTATAAGVNLLEQLGSDDRAGRGDSELISRVLTGLDNPGNTATSLDPKL